LSQEEPKEASIKLMTELSRESDKTKILIAYFEDDIIAFCQTQDLAEYSCFIIEARPENGRLYSILKDTYKELGFKAKELNVNE
jgi:hypothetical protein